MEKVIIKTNLRREPNFEKMREVARRDYESDNIIEEEYNIHRIKIVEMILTFADNYVFKFYKRATDNLFKVVEDIYYEYIQDLFERETNLLVSPFNRKGSTIVIGRDVI
jgi:hypothetical protein